MLLQHYLVLLHKEVLRLILSPNPFACSTLCPMACNRLMADSIGTKLMEPSHYLESA